jgi:glycosyltransferase involved in cell wall biosynthesis
MTAAAGLTVAVQSSTLAPHHVARLGAFARLAPSPAARVVGMAMFSRDSEYGWAPVVARDELFERCTVMECPSREGRRQPRALHRAVAGALTRLQPDVVVIHGWGHPESVSSLRWARRQRCPWILACDSSYDDARRRWAKELVKRWLIRGCRAALAAGTPQAEYLGRLGVPRERIFHPATCTVDNDYFERGSEQARARAVQLRQRLRLPERYFLSVARLVNKKNLPTLIRAYAGYRQRVDTAAHHLVLCGSGPDEEGLRRLVDSLGLGKSVHFSGFRQIDELPVLYGLASCFVLPSSHYEQWGLVINEAMASGLPVLVSRACGGARDLVREGENGFLFDYDDEARLAELLVRMHGSEEERQAMGSMSKKIVAGHSLEVAARNLWRAVAAAMGGATGAARPR